HRTAEREVVEAAPALGIDAERAARRLVEEAADAGRAHADRFGFEVEDLPHRAALPVQARIEPRSIPRERGLVLGQHRAREGAVGVDALMALSSAVYRG